MKTFVAIALLTGIGLGAAKAQDQYLWIKLSGNRVIFNAEPERIAGDSLIVVQDSRRVFVLIDEIDQIRSMREGSVAEGAAVGAGIGIAVGGTAGILAGSSNGKSWGVGFTVLAGGIIGGIIGSVAGSAGDMGDAIDLRGASVQEKKDLLECLFDVERDQ